MIVLPIPPVTVSLKSMMGFCFAACLEFMFIPSWAGETPQFRENQLHFGVETPRISTFNENQISLGLETPNSQATFYENQSIRLGLETPQFSSQIS